MSDVGKGLATGLLSLFGVGSAYDPLGKLRSELSQRTAEFNSLTASYSYQSAFQNNANLQALNDLMITNSAALEKHNEVTTSLIWDSLETENLFIVFLYALVFIIIIYLLVKT